MPGWLSTCRCYCCILVDGFVTLPAASGIQVIRSRLDLCLLTSNSLLTGIRHAEQLDWAHEVVAAGLYGTQLRTT